MAAVDTARHAALGAAGTGRGAADQCFSGLLEAARVQDVCSQGQDRPGAFIDAQEAGLSEPKADLEAGREENAPVAQTAQDRMHFDLCFLTTGAGCVKLTATHGTQIKQACSKIWHSDRWLMHRMPRATDTFWKVHLIALEYVRMRT